MSLCGNRKILRINGPNAKHYLQGLITNNINNVDKGSMIYSLFLNEKGRILYDSFICSEENSSSFLLDHDSRKSEELIQHLNKYKLRSKFSIDILPDLKVWNIDDDKMLLKEFKSPFKAFVDPRSSKLGYRVIADYSSLTTSTESYLNKRYKLGIPEGIDELIPNVSLPLESNADIMNGIDFSKGCYIGQELTIRTHHTGVIRKRIIPIRPSTTKTPLGFGSIFCDEKQVGKVLTFNNNYALCLFRLESLKHSKFLLKDNNNNVLCEVIPLSEGTLLHEKKIL